MSASGAGSTGLTVVAPANPAAGADWSFITTAAGLLVAVRAQIVTSAVVNNRSVGITISDGSGHIVCRSSWVSTPAASQQWDGQWFPGAPAQTVLGNRIFAPIPSLVVGAGWVIASQTGNLDVADQWSQIVLAFADR